MSIAIYFGAFRDMKFLHVSSLASIRHFILVDQLPNRVKYFEPKHHGYKTCFNEHVFVAELYRQLRKNHVKVVEMIQRPDFVKFIVLRDKIPITIDYYYNTTVEDVFSISEVGDIINHVDTIMDWDPFDDDKYVYTKMPNLKYFWMHVDEFEDYESTSVHLTIKELQDVLKIYGDVGSYWESLYGSDSDSNSN